MKKFFPDIRLVLGIGVGALLLAVFSSPVSAQPTVVPDIYLNAPNLGVSYDHAADAALFKRAPDGKTWELAAPDSIHIPGAPWFTVHELRFDADPLIYGNLLIQNVSAVTQTYTLGFTLPTTWAAPNLIRGSIDTSIIGTSATISALPNSSIYSALIDNNTVRTLQVYPFSLSTPQSANTSTAQFGFDPSNIPVNSSIGIFINFSLSPGDTAAIVSDFEVVAVPEPGSVGLALLGGATLLAWRRRRS